MLKPLRDQIDGFQKRVNQVHDETLRGNVSLGMEIKHVMEMGQKISSEANSLASALKGDKKTTGNWGEVQLERTLQLAGLMPDVHYQAQPAFKDQQGNRRQPDFIVKLPDQKHIVIDSKVSLVDYDRAIAAQTDSEIQMALDAHVKAVKNHIDDLGKKDYSNLIGMRSPSFVLMFMPIEPAYIEAMKHNQDLFNYGYQRNVVMVSSVERRCRRESVDGPRSPAPPLPAPTASASTIPQWPWLMYSQRQTSVMTRMSGTFSLISRTALWMTPSFASAPEAISSFFSGIPKRRIAGIPSSFIRAASLTI